MLTYVIKRIIMSIITVWLVVTITFFLVHAMPGGPFDGDKITPDVKKNMEVKYGLNKPLVTQYALYLKNLIRGDLGESMIFRGQKVGDKIKSGFPNSARVGLVSVIFSLIVGIALGLIAALKSGKWQDKICMLIATLGITIPSFVIAAVLIYVFASKLHVLPTTGFDSGKSYVMPVIALSGSALAFITRLTRSKLIEVLKSDYIRTAKAKGLSDGAINLKHALRNSLLPVVTYLGPLIAGILTGSFVIEKIFAIPGLGNEFTATVTNRDYSSLLGVLVFYSALIILINLIVDLLYVVIDPRIDLNS